MLTTRPLFISFFCFVALFIVCAPAVNANAIDSIPAHRRAHAARMIRKRSPQGLTRPPPLVQVGEDPEETGSTATSGTVTGVTTTTTTGTVTTTTGTSTTTSGTTTTSTSSTSSSTSTSTTSTSTSSTSRTTTSTTSTSESVIETPPVTSEDLAATALPATTTPPQHVTLTVTSSTQQQESQTSLPKTSGATALPKTTVTILIAIGASIGGAIILWTVIRLWKFRPSSKFEDRMQPIDWQPSVGHDDGLPGSLRRTTSNASHGSFHSGSDHGSSAHGSQGRGYGASSDHGHGRGGFISDLPAHDFTAGPSHIGGYADLARGPSPQPQMQETLHRGPSFRSYDPFHNGSRY